MQNAPVKYNLPYKDHDKELARIKKNVEMAYEYFRGNYERFNRMKQFVFISSNSEVDESVNKTLNRPNLEFPVLESGVSRLRGEFVKNLPSIYVTAEEGLEITEEMGVMIRVVEGHIRHIMSDAEKRGVQFELITDTLAGGFTGAHVYSAYRAPMSFIQDIYIDKVFDPTMTFWDPMAKEIAKLDGRHCGQCIPMYEDEFKKQFPDVKTDEMKFGANMGNFKWSYDAKGEKIALLCYYYENKPKKTKIVYLTDGRSMTTKEYKKFLSDWDEDGKIEQPPQIMLERDTEIPRIYRYTLCETKILECKLTDYERLPIPFIDGNSTTNKESDQSTSKQFTRPIVYPAQGAQRLKNYAGQALANELENMIMHKWTACIEGIPENYSEAYKDVQQASVLVYNAFKDGNPEMPLPPPQAVVRPPIPPEITQTFMIMDTTIQNILGSFDPAIAKLGEREVSGIAIQESLSLSNSAAMPYVTNYLLGLQAIADLILDLIPKVYKTPRTLPIITEDGKKDYVVINAEGGVRLDYDRNALKVEVVAGPSFMAQQDKALRYIDMLMKSSPMFQQFMAEKGLPVLLDNMEFRGIDLLKEEVAAFVEEFKVKQSKAQQQPNPEMVKMEIAKQQLAAKQQSDMMEARIKAAELDLERQKLQLNAAQLAVDTQEIQINAQLDREKYHSEDMRKAAEMVMKAEAHSHKISKEQKELEHMLSERESE